MATSEPHEVTDACASWHCLVHNVDEPVPSVQLPGARLCGECGHYYPSGEALVAADEWVDAEIYGHHPDWGQPRGRRPLDHIFACPLCCHDF